MDKIKNIDIDLKSDLMNEMLSDPPKRIIRSGNGIFLIFLAIIIGLSCLISYPDEIKGEVVVSSNEPPIELSNQMYAQLRKLSVSDGQFVFKNQLIAQFDNEASALNIKKAENYLTSIKLLEYNLLSQIPEAPGTLKLGSFQELWTSLENKVLEWNESVNSGIDREQVAAINREISYREKLQDISSQKIKLSESEYTLIAEELRTSQKLSENKAISGQTLHQDKRSENQAKQTIQSQKEQYVQNLIQLNSLKKELLEFENDQKLKENSRISGLKSTISSLETGFAAWRKNAVLVAPCSGKVLFNRHLQVNRYYEANQATIVIAPRGNKYSALATIDASGAGKVGKGQKVFIELMDYPINEYGKIEGFVSDITQIEKEGKYEVRIQLPKQLKTTYNKFIPLKAQLKGQVKIITKNKRLFSRFFEKFTDLIK